MTFSDAGSTPAASTNILFISNSLQELSAHQQANATISGLWQTRRQLDEVAIVYDSSNTGRVRRTDDPPRGQYVSGPSIGHYPEGMTQFAILLLISSEQREPPNESTSGIE